MFIIDLNAAIRRGFINLTVDYQKLGLEIVVVLMQNVTKRNLRDHNKFGT